VPRFLRYLRIAFSVTCLIACVLLIVLWVRSYWFHDYLNCPEGGGWSGLGTVCVVIHPSSRETAWHPWTQRWSESDTAALLKFVSPIKWRYHTGYLATWIAYWLLTFFAFTVAMIPWFKWRFSLRTLLTVMTVLAVALGLLASIPRA
jgi:hypothetical protein